MSDCCKKLYISNVDKYMFGHNVKQGDILKIKPRKTQASIDAGYISLAPEGAQATIEVGDDCKCGPKPAPADAE